MARFSQSHPRCPRMRRPRRHRAGTAMAGPRGWALPTVLLASRPGLGQFAKHDLRRRISGRCSPRSKRTAAGDRSMPSSPDISRRPSRWPLAAQAIARIKAANENPVCVDPIWAMREKLYVARETAEAIRDQLLPLASIATPNLFELQWLTGTSSRSAMDCTRGTRTRAADLVVTSALPAEANISDGAGGRRGLFEDPWLRVQASPTVRATCSPGCCWATCSTGIPARRHSTPACKTSTACLPPARGSRSCNSRDS